MKKYQKVFLSEKPYIDFLNWLKTIGFITMGHKSVVGKTSNFIINLALREFNCLPEGKKRQIIERALGDEYV
jgi:hypothetical protein